jgi:hypothetical protein
MQVHLGNISNSTQCRYGGENNAPNEQMGGKTVHRMALETNDMTEMKLPTLYS